MNQLRASLIIGLCFSGLGIVYKYLGGAGLIVYIPLTAAAVWAALGHYSSLRDRLDDRYSIWAGVALFSALAVAFAIVYPLANSGIFGAGSDADDALNIAVRKLLAGQYPYYPQTYLDNEISPMPGAVFLATPFVVLGTSALQNLVWVGGFFVWLWHKRRDAFDAGFFACLLLSSPAVLQQVMTGSDLVSNAVYVALGCLAVISTASEERVTWKGVAGAAFLGIALSSRAHFLFVTPLLFPLLARQAEWRRALTLAGCTAATFLAITLPFFIYDPAAFSPLHTASKLNLYDSVVPYFSWIVLTVTACVVVLLASRVETEKQFLWASSVVLAIPIIAVVVVSTIWAGGWGLLQAGYGVSFLPFLILAAALDLTGSEPERVHA